MSSSNQNQNVYLGDSLEAARRLRMPQSESALPQHIANLRTVVLNPENDVSARRAAYVALRRSSEQGAEEVLAEFTTLGLTLSEPPVVSPRSPKHPDGTVTGAIE